MALFERIQKTDQDKIKQDFESVIASILTSSILTHEQKQEFKDNLSETLISRPVLEPHEIALDDQGDLVEALKLLKTIKHPDFSSTVKKLEQDTYNFLTSYPQTRETTSSFLESTYGAAIRGFKSAYRTPWTRSLAESSLRAKMDESTQKMEKEQITRNQNTITPVTQVSPSKQEKSAAEDLDKSQFGAIGAPAESSLKTKVRPNVEPIQDSHIPPQTPAIHMKKLKSERGH